MSEQSQNDKFELDAVPAVRITDTSLKVGTAILWLGCLVFIDTLIISWHCSQERRRLQNELGSLESKHAELTDLFERRQDARSRVQKDRQVIEQFIGLCRDATDVPNWECDRIVSSSMNMENTAVYVPAGQHVLTVVARWKSKDSATSAKPENHQAWKIPLLGKSGYWFEVLTESKNAVEWRLSGNHPDFRAQGGSLPFQTFSDRARHGINPIKYPNEVENTAEAILNPLKLPPPSVKVFNLQFDAQNEHRKIEVDFDVLIESDGPPIVPASKAGELLSLRNVPRLWNVGDGKYGWDVGSYRKDQ